MGFGSYREPESKQMLEPDANFSAWGALLLAVQTEINSVFSDHFLGADCTIGNCKDEIYKYTARVLPFCQRIEHFVMFQILYTTRLPICLDSRKIVYWPIGTRHYGQKRRVRRLDTIFHNPRSMKTARRSFSQWAGTRFF